VVEAHGKPQQQEQAVLAVVVLVPELAQMALQEQ
jgi:hypothetical protein